MGRAHGLYMHHSAAVDARDGSSGVEAEGRGSTKSPEMVGPREGDRAADECL